MFSAKLIAFAACAQSAFAALYVTSPVATTSWAAGQQQTISWQDDGKTPSLQDFGPALITVDVGNAIQQTPLQTVIGSVDVSTTQSVVFTPDPNMGANGADYFIRIQSLGLKDATQPQYPALAFSAKFTFTGMSGQFNATVQQQIDGASTAPIGGPAPTSAPSTTSPTSAPSSPSSPPKTTSSTGSPSPSKGAQGDSSKNSGAFTLVASSAAVVAGSVFAVCLNTLSS